MPQYYTRPLPCQRLAFLLLCSLFVGFSLRPVPAHAENVTLEFAGLTLSGNLELAERKSLRRNGVLLIVHDSLDYAGAPPISALQQALKQQGINSLAITLSLGFDHRQTALPCAVNHDHRDSDAPGEIIAWIRWLISKRSRHIALLGLGRGATQMANALLTLSAKKKQNRTILRRLQRVIMIDPLTGSAEHQAERYQALHKRALADEIARATNMVAKGEPYNLMTTGFLSCTNANVTAQAFLDYYTPTARHDALNLVPSILKPLLIIAHEAAPDYPLYQQNYAATATDKQRQFLALQSQAPRLTAQDAGLIADHIKTFLTRK